MAYGKKYILSLISDRGNDYRVEILQQGYTGTAVNKSFGTVPTLSIEEGDGRIKGSSLAFSIQADAEGELSGLYTTNNKEYKVLLYRNSTLYWQGYLLPELYSENYVDPPFDVAVTATDQLATLKDVEYQGEDVLTSLLDIIKGILLNTKVDIPCTIHMQLSSAQGALLQNSYISAASYNGQNCYDVLNAILLSCNSSIMQMGNRWLIASLTDASTAYTTDGASENIPFTTIGQMGKADVCPDGSLVMVNSPAFKGATVEYNHTLRKSMLLNPECINKDNWEYNNVDSRFPGTSEVNGVVYKHSFWFLNQKQVQNNNTLQLWQDISLKLDTFNTYDLSFKTMFVAGAEMLLLYVAYTSDYGTTWYLTTEGWKTEFNASKAASYIQITGQSKGYALTVYEISDKTKYETTTVRFKLPDVQGKLKVGFINNAPEDSDGTAHEFHTIAVTDVFLTIATISGKTSTTLVEENASSSQEEIAITYGEAIESTNADKLELSYLRASDGQKIESIVLSGREYPSYYLAMVQDFSRYYGVKKMQLQGALMGTDVLSYLYKDVFSDKVCRLLGGQYNLLDDSISVNLEEVPTAFVDYNLVVYAKENTSKNDTTTAGGAVAVGAGDSHIGVQADGDAYVKNDRPLLGKESRFENVALPTAEPERVVERTYIYSSDPSRYPSVNLTAMSDTMVTLQSGLTDVSRRVTDLEKLFYYDEEHDAVRTSMSLIIDKWITFGGIGMGQGTVTGATELDGLNDVQITRPEGGQVLMYDEDLGLWVNRQASANVSLEISEYPEFGVNVPCTTSIYTESGEDWLTFLSNRKSLMGGLYSPTWGIWRNTISVRHGNGSGDGSGYGMYITTHMNAYGNLFWNKQVGPNTWQGEREIIDSSNITSYISEITGVTGGPYVKNIEGEDFNPSDVVGNYFGMTTQSGITASWRHIISLDWRSDIAKISEGTVSPWTVQLSLPTYTTYQDGCYYRTFIETGPYSGWIRFLDSNNYSSYALPLSGGTVNGNVNIVGNLDVAGAVTFKLASDRRLKDNIKPLTVKDTIRVLYRLRPVSFEWNEIAFSLDNTKEGLCDGFLADEYEKLIPNSGRAIWEKYRAIDYTRAIPYLAKGWQIHESELDKMRKKVKIMERRIEHLENILVEHNIMVA